MNFLFIHQNFPGQYAHVAGHLAAEGHRVVFITQERTRTMPGVHKIEYVPLGPATPGHPYVREIDVAVRNGLAVARQCETLQWDGFTPDLVIGHNGWGEIFYIKDLWPQAPLLGYFEFFYRASGSDVGCDPEFPSVPEDALRLRTRNAINLIGLDAVDWGQTPTRWQRDQYPTRYREGISVIHEGIDTEHVRPDPSARLWLRDGLSLSADDEVITYCARNLEPYRGFHVFMRALPLVLRQRPRARVVIVGGNGVSYGRSPSAAPTWREQMLNELDGKLDLDRIHFLGHLPYPQYLAVLQLSTVHVYLTYPFVLSWSLLEAMAAGCVVVGSRTPPLEEVVRDGENGYLVDLFDRDGLADRIAFACRSRAQQQTIRAAARETVTKAYDLRAVCLPAHLALYSRLIGSPVSL